MTSDRLRVTWLELRAAPSAVPAHAGPEHVAEERLAVDDYLDLYRRVGTPLRWDQRLRMPRDELAELLASERSSVHVLRGAGDHALGFCEFERGADGDVELRNFGLVPEMQGRGLGPWLLASALHAEWRRGVARIWLHTDTWDHPAAVRVYERAGFRVYAVSEEDAGPL